MKVEIRNSDVYKELHELYKKAEDDANKLNSDLLDEKEKTQKLEMRLTEAEKVTEELRKKVSELEKNAKTSTGMIDSYCRVYKHLKWANTSCFGYFFDSKT